MANQVLFARRDEIMAQIRPEVLNRLNDSENRVTLFDFFSADDNYSLAMESYRASDSFTRRIPQGRNGRPPFFRTASLTWQSDRERSTSPETWGEPTEEEMGYAFLRSMRNSGGRQLSPFAASMPNIDSRLGYDVLNSIAPMGFQVHDVQKQGCRLESRGVRCAWNGYIQFTIADQMAADPIYMQMVRLMNSNYGGRSDGRDDAGRIAAGRQVYEWAERDADFPLRSVRQRFLTHGSFHILANRLALGWHPDFRATGAGDE